MNQFHLIFVLLVVYQLKHFLADYPLQFGYMLGKFKKTGWVGPLFVHAFIHAQMTFVIASLFAPKPNLLLALWLGLFDFSIHFIMDRIKASPNLMGRWKALSGTEYVSALERKKQFETEPFTPESVKSFSQEEIS